MAEHEQMLRTSYPEFPPYVFTGKNGKVEGAFVDSYRATLELAGFKAEFTPAPTARSLYMLKSGEADVWLGISGVQELEGHVLNVPAPEASIELKLYCLETTPVATGLSDIGGKTLVALERLNYNGLLDQAKARGDQFHVIKIEGIEKALRILVSGRADYLLAYHQPVQEALQSHPIAGLRGHTLFKEPAAFVVSKKARNAETIYQRLLDAYRRLHSEVQPSAE